MSKLLIISIILLQLVIPFISLGKARLSDTIIISTDFNQQTVDQKVHYFVDSTSRLSVDSVSKISQHDWVSKARLPFNGGYNTYPVWVHATIVDSTENSMNWVLRLNHPLLDTVLVYIKDSSSVSHYAISGNIQDKNWPTLPIASPSIVLPSIKNKAYEVYILVRATDVCAISLDIVDMWHLQKSENFLNTFFGIYFGSVALIVLINVFLYFTANFSSCLWYSLYVTSFALFQASACGLLNYSFFKNAWLLQIATPFTGSICIVFSTLFMREFLNLANGSSQLGRILSRVFIGFVILGAVLCCLVPFGHGRFSAIGGSVVAPLLIVLFLFAAIALIRSIGRSAIFATIALSFLTLGIITNALRNFGVLPNIFLTAHGNLLGSVFEFIIIAIALVDRISTIEKEKNVAHENVLLSRRLALECRLQTLQAQINPHFLFNTLNTLAEFISIYPKKAEKLVLDLSRFFRYTLIASEKSVVTLKDELEIVRTYLTIQKERFGERLEFEILGESEISNISSLGLLIQPIVENSIKYGIAPLPKGGRISIECAVLEDTVAIKVHDTGIGFGEATSSGTTGHGLNNVKERLMLAYGDKASIVCTNDNGASVSIIFPKKEFHGV